MELNRRGRRQAGGGKSTFEVGLRLKLIYFSFIKTFEVGLSLEVDQVKKILLGDLESVEVSTIYRFLPSRVSFCQT